MTLERKDEIIRRVFYRHIESIMRDLEQCVDTHIIFQLGMEMGLLHRDLEEELEEELQKEAAE